MTGAAAPARRVALALAGITALALALRAFHLGGQPLIGDDEMVGRTARNFVELGWPSPTMWNHPRLRDLLVYASLQALGEGAWGLKAWSVILGTLSVPAVAALVLLAGGSEPAALAAAAIVAVDPLHLDFSRQAINDVHLALFPAAAVAALLRHRTSGRPGWLAAAGLLLGLGVAEKWSAAFPVGAAAATTLAGTARTAGPGERLAGWAFAAAALLLLPLAVYLATFAPWFGRGHDLGEWVRLQVAMARETATHAGYQGTKLPGYPGEVVGAWRWFTAPIWYVDYVPAAPGRAGVPAGGLFLSGVANPATWLATLPAAALAALAWRREGDVAAGWLLLLFLAAWLPFVAVPRPIWTNSAPSVLPFAAALVGWAAARLHPRHRLPVRVWAAAALAGAALLWSPAMGISTRPGDALLRVLVSPAALDPANHP